MRLVHRSLAVGIAAAGILAATSGSALGATIDVFRGGSIQAAVKSAHRGDMIVVHPGVYRQSVSIKKDGLTLRGAGPSKSGSVIRPGSNHRCGHGGSGICVVEHKPHGGGDKVPTAGTRISGFLVRGFKDSGFLALNARNTVVRHNKFLSDGEYGAAAFVSRRTRFLNNVAKNAGEAGFYIGGFSARQGFPEGQHCTPQRRVRLLPSRQLAWARRPQPGDAQLPRVRRDRHRRAGRRQKVGASAQPRDQEQQLLPGGRGGPADFRARNRIERRAPHPRPWERRRGEPSTGGLRLLWRDPSGLGRVGRRQPTRPTSRSPATGCAATSRPTSPGTARVRA